jgi:hypothetical protein
MATMKETLNCVRQVQIVQKNTESLLVRYAAQGDERSIEEELKRLCVLFNDIMKTPVRVNFVRLAEIPREQSGKLRLCISEVKRDANAMS